MPADGDSFCLNDTWYNVQRLFYVLHLVVTVLYLIQKYDIYFYSVYRSSPMPIFMYRILKDVEKLVF